MNMEDLYRLLRTGHVQAQGIVDTVSEPLLVLDAGLCVQAASRSFFETFGVDRYETIGKPLYALGNGQWDIPELRRLLSDIIPKSTAIINYEVEHDFPDLGRKTMLLTARTLHHPDTASHSMLLAIVDATEQHRRDVAKDMLFGELRHRMMNLLGVAQSIARLTTTEGRTAEEYRDAFLGRFTALIEAEDLAFSEQDAGGLPELLKRIFAPFGENLGAVVIEPGPAVDLGPRRIKALSLILHELATNAAKYGALSVASGRVAVNWKVENAKNTFRLRWIESDGPAVSPPATSGYGTKLIQSTTHGLRGELEQDYALEGLRVEILIPLVDKPITD